MTTDGEQLYNKLAEKTEVREVEGLDGQEDGTGKSLDEKMDETPDDSDLQTALKQLFPAGLGDKIINKLMVARISPDVFIPLMKLLVNAECMRTDPSVPIDVEASLAKHYILLSIGLDGKGRIDHVELAGASKDADDLEKLGGLFSK